MAQLVVRSTRMHSIVAFPAAVFLAAFALPLVDIWVGDRLAHATNEVGLIVSLIAVFLPGVVATSVAQAWVFVMHGMGRVKPVAILTLSALAVFCALCGLAAVFLRGGVFRFVPAWAYSVAIVTVQVGPLAFLVARSTGQKVRVVFRSLGRPALIAVLLGLAGNIFLDLLHLSSGAAIATAASLYGLLYAAGIWWLELRKEERREFLFAMREFWRRREA